MNESVRKELKWTEHVHQIHAIGNERCSGAQNRLCKTQVKRYFSVGYLEYSRKNVLGRFQEKVQCSQPPVEKLAGTLR